MKEKLKKYAEIIVKIGINLKERDGVYILHNIDDIPLVKEITKICWELGAKDIITELEDLELLAYKYENAKDFAFDKVEDFKIENRRNILKNNYHLIMLGAPSLDSFKNMDIERQEKEDENSYRLYTPIIEFQDAAKLKWVGVASPTARWAKKLFPNLEVKEAIDELWDKIFMATRADLDNPIEAWSEHNKKLKCYVSYLNEQNFEYLEYKGSNIDLKVYLADNHRWSGGVETTADGEEYIANIPTEEIFTAPHRLKVDGRLTTTKPFSRMGETLEEFTLVFKDGEVVEYSAVGDVRILENYLNKDENSKRLGEVAIVPDSSPISKMNILFYSTLFDENASCHFALGNSYSENIIDGEKLSNEERMKMGANISKTHNDFMVGSGELNIIGYKKDGSSISILKNGEWDINV